MKFSLCRTAQMFCAKMHRRNGAFRRSAIFSSGIQGIPVVAESQELGHCGVSHVSLTFLFVPKRRSSESSGHGFPLPSSQNMDVFSSHWVAGYPAFSPFFSFLRFLFGGGWGCNPVTHMESLFIAGPDQQFPVTPRMTLFTLT